jgi:hypothetical protein
MHLKNLLSKEMWRALEDVMEECKTGFPYFNPNDMMHQMFALNILTARRVEKLEKDIKILDRDIMRVDLKI